MIGQRIEYPEWETADPEPGTYWKGKDGKWYAMTPNGMLGSLAAHKVQEHPDGTITVSPSILVTGVGQYHGYLERGVWREA